MAEGGDFRHLSTSHNARESRLKSTFDQEIHPSVCPLDADWSKFTEVQRGTSGRSGLLLQTAVSVDSPPFGHPGVSRHSKAKHAWNRGEIDRYLPGPWLPRETQFASHGATRGRFACVLELWLTRAWSEPGADVGVEPLGRGRGPSRSLVYSRVSGPRVALYPDHGSCRGLRCVFHRGTRCLVPPWGPPLTAPPPRARSRRVWIADIGGARPRRSGRRLDVNSEVRHGGRPHPHGGQGIE